MTDIVDWFGAAVGDVTRSIQRGEEVDPEALTSVLRGLETYLSNHFRLSSTDRSEVASEAMTRFFEFSQTKAMRSGTAAGLLTTMARNLAVDHLRRTTRETPSGYVIEAVDSQAARDDEISALLDRRADRSAIRQAMAALLALDDVETVKVIRVWLDLADELGHAPTTRAVGDALGVSHTTVARALRRFQEFVPDDPPPA